MAVNSGRLIGMFIILNLLIGISLDIYNNPTAENSNRITGYIDNMENNQNMIS